MKPSWLLLAANLALLLASHGGQAYRLGATLPWQQQQQQIRGQQQTAAASADAAAATTGGSRPWFCRSLDCPSFEVLETAGHLQLRRYKRQSFLVTRVEAQSLLEAQIIGSKRLLGYLAGENEDGVKLPPTVPLNSVLLTADRSSETVKGRFYFAIYLPDRVQDDAPKPNDRELRIVRLPRRAVWVDTFDEPLLTESAIIRRGWELIRELQSRHRAVDERAFAFALYEPPLPFVPHHYEIAVRARCRKADDSSLSSSGVAVGGPTTLADGIAAAFGDVGSSSSSKGAMTVSDDDDDDYPFPEEGGGGAEDDECDSDDTPQAVY